MASGVTATEPGQGSYDQGLAGSKIIYVHNPAGGDWDVNFFYVGPGQGDYILDSLTESGGKVFVHQGDGQGNHLVGRPLARPSSQSVATINAALGDTAGDHFQAEWSFGNHDLNQLSDLDNGDNQGSAGRLEARFQNKQVVVAGRSLGRTTVRAFWEKQDAEFRPFQVHKTVFDFDNWGLADRARREGFLDQENSEAGVDGLWQLGGPGKSLEIKGNLGRLDHGDNLEADRLSGTVKWQLGGGRGSHGQQTAHASDSVDPLDITHQSKNHQLSWILGPVVPVALYNFRQWEDAKISGGRSAGYRLEELGTGLASAPGRNLAWRLDFKRALADSLYLRADWQWASVRPPTIGHGWKPEEGFLPYDWRGYNEAMLMYLMALGSPSHPVAPEAWEAWTSGYQWGNFHGQEHLGFAPLFGHQYTLVWYDMRGIRDPFMQEKDLDYFENSRRAVLAQYDYALENPAGWVGYGPRLWGLTACDGPVNETVEINGTTRTFNTYWARGASFTRVADDGTVCPSAAAASLPFAPDIVLPTLMAMKEDHGELLFGEYGFLDALNPTFTLDIPVQHGRVVPGRGWYDTDYLGIDQGPILAMIENHRSGLVWETMKKNPHIIRGLKAAGFAGGWLEDGENPDD